MQRGTFQDCLPAYALCSAYAIILIQYLSICCVMLFRVICLHNSGLFVNLHADPLQWFLTFQKVRPLQLQLCYLILSWHLHHVVNMVHCISVSSHCVQMPLICCNIGFCVAWPTSGHGSNTVFIQNKTFAKIKIRLGFGPNTKIKKFPGNTFWLSFRLFPGRII